VDGTLSANNLLNIEGANEGDGSVRILAHGKLIALGDGSVRLGALQFKVVGPDRPAMGHGSLLFLQMQGGPSWGQPGPIQDVSGHWMGDYKPAEDRPGGGCIEFDFAQLRAGGDFANGGPLTTAFQGTVHLDDVFLPGMPQLVTLNMDAQGTIGPLGLHRDGSPLAPFAAIGMTAPPDPDKPGIIAVLIGLLTSPPDPEKPATIQGTYRLYNSLTDLVQGILIGLDQPANQGSFLVNAGTED
jgi:hypothetical protein